MTPPNTSQFPEQTGAGFGAFTGHQGLAMDKSATGPLWQALGQGFAQFFPAQRPQPEQGESTMDSPSL